MPICRNCYRDMGNFNVQFCSLDCRNGVDVEHHRPMLRKYPPNEANVGLKRPYGGKTYEPHSFYKEAI